MAGAGWTRRVMVISACLCAAAVARAQSAPEELPPPVPRQVAEDATQVVDVQIQGHRETPLARISPHIRTRAGRPFDPEIVEEDVRRLIRSRQFIDVRPHTQQVPGGVVVVFQVVERRTIRYVRYVGRVKVRREKALADKTTLKVGDALDPFAVEEGRRKLEEFYQERGHGKIRVAVLEGDKPDDRGVIYLIHEGPRQRVSQVSFVGNSDIVSGRRLQTQIQTRKPYVWLFKGYVDRAKIDEDQDRLTAYYRSLGFFQAKIGRELEWDDDSDRLHVTFVISEGPRYQLRDVRFLGHTKFQEAELREKLELTAGEFFDQATMDQDVRNIQDVYGGAGYVFANVVAEPRFLEEPGQLDLVYRVEEGSRHRIGTITVKITGEHPHTKQTAVLNRLSLYPGDIADIRELRSSELRLKRSSIFMNNPAQGSAPRIVFSEPETDVENLAERPTQDGVRGQSPDQPHVVRRPPAGGSGEGADVRPLDVAIVEEAELEQLNAPGAARRWKTLARGLTTLPAAVWSWRESLFPRGVAPGAVPGAPAPSATNPQATAPAAGARSSNPPAPAVARPVVVRGQDGWSPFGGAEMPSPSTTNRGVFGRRSPPVASPGSVARRVPQYTAQVPPPSTDPQPPPLVPLGAPNSVGAAPQGYAPPGGYVPQPTSGASAPYTSPYSTAAPPAPFAPPSTNPAGSVYAQVPTGGLPAPNYAPPSQGAPPIGYAAPGGVGALPASGASANPGMAPPSGYDNPGELFPEGGYLNAAEEPTQDVPVVVEVEETQTGRIMLGAGVNSNAGLVGNFIVDEQNFDISRWPGSWAELRDGVAFRGAGQQFRLEAVPGTQFQRYSAVFREPYLFNTPISFALSGHFFNRRYRDWDEERLGGQLTWGYQIRPDLSGTIGLRAENVNLSNPRTPAPLAVTRALGNNGLYTARFGLVQDTRDSAFMPTEGHRIDLGYEQAFGEFLFPKIELDLRKHFLIRQRADGSGRHTITLSSTTNVGLSTLPVFENYFAGGFSTIRGYSFRGASPRDLGVIVGGRFMFLASAEYMFPITADDMLRGVIFCDTGTVETDVKIRSENFRVAPGFGLRITIPAMGPAPIALDFAFPVLNAPGDAIQNFSFFVGFNR